MTATEQMDIDSQIFFIPGEKVCNISDELSLGFGVYQKESEVISSLAGKVLFEEKEGRKIVSIKAKRQVDKIIPKPGDIVKCIVTNIQLNYAFCNINIVNNIVLPQPFKAMIKRDDIRVQDKEITDMSKVCLLGDIIIGKVVGIGDNGCRLLQLLPTVVK